VHVKGTSGSMHVRIFNHNLKELQVIESKSNAIRRSLVCELLNTQDRVLYSYYAQRNWERGEEHQQQGGILDEMC
jgi:hypothetical protein